MHFEGEAMYVYVINPRQTGEGIAVLFGIAAVTMAGLGLWGGLTLVSEGIASVAGLPGGDDVSPFFGIALPIVMLLVLVLTIIWSLSASMRWFLLIFFVTLGLVCLGASQFEGRDVEDMPGKLALAVPPWIVLLVLGRSLSTSRAVGASVGRTVSQLARFLLKARVLAILAILAVGGFTLAGLGFLALNITRHGMSHIPDPTHTFAVAGVFMLVFFVCVNSLIFLLKSKRG